MKEEWRVIKGFEDYMISDQGNVKSLKFGKEKILRSRKKTNGFYAVVLDGKNKSIHILIAEEFLDYKVDRYTLVSHKDNNKLNNVLSNLQIVNPRDNKSNYKLGTSSIYNGVCFLTRKNKWQSSISVDGKRVYLGSFDTEEEAHESYQEASGRLNSGLKIMGTNRISKYKCKGLVWDRIDRIWKVYIRYKADTIFLGSFKKDLDGLNAFQKAYLRTIDGLSPIEE